MSAHAEQTSKAVSVRAVGAAHEIAADTWNALANPSRSEASDEWDYNPFLAHAFFDAVERSGSATRRTGWMPHHLLMEREGEAVGLLPCYVKSHSQGEYVFDYGWADAFERAGGDYYPKLQCSVPFTPATGRRLLVGNGDDRLERQALLGEGLRQVCEELGVSSAHITFQRTDEAKLLEAMGYLERNDQQYHWHNLSPDGDPYASFDDFLGSLASRKRKAIRKERAEALQNVTIERLTGADLTDEVWDTFFRFYMDTGSRKWGRPYLTRDFYTRIGATMADDVLLVMARSKEHGRYVAGAINFVGSHTLFGRHWGCTEHHPMLHFEVCYYQAIDYAIEHGLRTVEAGAQGSHKLARGYMPTITHSTHHITHPQLRQAVASYLAREREAVAYEAEVTERHGPFRKSG